MFFTYRKTQIPNPNSPNEDLNLPGLKWNRISEMNPAGDPGLYDCVSIRVGALDLKGV